MKKEEREKLEMKLDQHINEQLEEYRMKAEEHIDKLDLKRLQAIKNKKLADITQDDLEFIGFRKQKRGI